jgi:hypothetical protein
MAIETGPATDLARLAYTWRNDPPAPNDPTVLPALPSGLLPLYRLFIDDYTPRLRQYGEPDLAASLLEWQRRLA